MRVLSQQLLHRGRRAHYHVALVQNDHGAFELICRWLNPRNTNRRASLCASEQRGRELFEGKLAEMQRRGYQPAPARPPRARSGERAPDRDAAGADPIEVVLAMRRKEAPWPMD